MNIILTTLNAKYIHTNLALRYLKAYAQPEFQPKIIEFTIKDPLQNIVSDLMRHQPNVIGFSCYIWNIEETLKVIQSIKKINPSITIVVGGPEVSYDVSHWLSTVSYIDFIIIGEGEVTFKKLLHTIQGNGDLETIDGLAFTRNDGTQYIRPLTSKVDLTTLPSPYRFEEDIEGLKTRVSYVETSRGCPFSCQFCLSSIDVGVRYFNREVIKDDIRYLMDNGSKLIKFVDRTFNISRSYAMDMFQFLIDEHKPGVVFQFEITADIMRPEVIEFLNNNAPKGLFRFEIGVQSTNDRTNELVQRKQNWDKLVRTVTLVRDGEKIDQHLDLIAGLPEEDYSSFAKTFDDVFALRPEELQLGFLKMLRGTGLRHNAAKWGYVYSDFAPYEILRNDALSYEDMQRIKQAEDMLEKYWNSSRFHRTLSWLLHNSDQSPFYFFQKFGAYWDECNYAKIGYQLEDLFSRLDAWLQKQVDETRYRICQSLLLIDFLSAQKYYPRKIWWDASLTADQRTMHLRNTNEKQRNHYYSELPTSEKELYKLTRVEEFDVDVQTLLQEGRVVPTKATPYAIYWNPKVEKPVFVKL